MAIQEKRSIVSLVSTILVLILYAAFMLPKYPESNSYSPEVFHFWGSFILVFIPVSIVAKIVIYILFSIMNTIATREAESSLTDERDKLIELKSARNGLFMFAIGFLLAMGTLVLSMPPSAMFIVLLGAGVMSEVINDVSLFYFYRRGF